MIHKSELSPVFLARVVDFLSGQVFPATKSELIGRARHANTTSDIYAALLHLPEMQFGSMADVRLALGGSWQAART